MIDLLQIVGDFFLFVFKALYLKLLIIGGSPGSLALSVTNGNDFFGAVYILIEVLLFDLKVLLYIGMVLYGRGIFLNLSLQDLYLAAKRYPL